MLLQNLIFIPYHFIKPDLTKLLLKYMHWFGMVKLGNWIHPSNPMLKTAKIGLTMQWAAVKL